MDRKTKIYKAACYVNLISMPGIVAMFIWRGYLSYFSPAPLALPASEEIIMNTLVLLIVGIHIVNGYWGIKLVSHLGGEYGKTLGVNRRVVFWIFEILLAIFYSIMITALSLTSFWSMSFNNLVRIVFLISFTCSYISSLIRIFLFWPILNLAKRKARSAIEQIGKE